MLLKTKLRKVIKSEMIRTNISLNILHTKKNFWAGVALAAPFYAEFFSWYFAIFLALPLGLAIITKRPDIRLPSIAIFPMAVLILSHFLAIFYSQSKFQFQITKDLLIATFLLMVYIMSDDDALDGFLKTIMPLGIISAFLGIAKAALLDRGYVLGLILENCGYYPAGSALCVNYNNLGMIWLITAIACLRNGWWRLLPVLITAGLLSSSRRFIVLATMLPFVWIFLEGKTAVIKSVLVAGLIALLLNAVTDSESFERFRFGNEPYTVLFINNIDEIILTTNRSNPTAMLGTMTDGTLGTASRLDYWRLALDNIRWFPQGWQYHEDFSCSFSDCSDFHYPHMSIMSEWLIGGIVLGLTAIMFYLLPLFLVMRNKSVVHISILLFSLPYSLISGDTVFSLPIYLGCMLVALSSLPRKQYFIRT